MGHLFGSFQTTFVKDPSRSKSEHFWPSFDPYIPCKSALSSDPVGESQPGLIFIPKTFSKIYIISVLATFIHWKWSQLLFVLGAKKGVNIDRHGFLIWWYRWKENQKVRCRCLPKTTLFSRSERFLPLRAPLKATFLSWQLIWVQSPFQYISNGKNSKNWTLPMTGYKVTKCNF